MKSVTVTTQNAINYGAVLQAYALQTALKTLGVDNELLDIPVYDPIIMPIGFNFSRDNLIKIALNCGRALHYREIKEQRDNFKNFRENILNTTKVYNNVKEVKDNPPVADFYVTGSDQVFGLRCDVAAVRLLNFGDDFVKRFSYAASLGEYDWNDKEKRIFNKMLSKFDMISVREKYAKEYIESFSDKKPDVHIDPTFLLEKSQWHKIIKNPNTKDKYILCFPLLGNDKLQEAVDELKRQTGYKVYCIQTNPIKRIKADKNIYNAGPRDFLGYINNAEAVVTTSFHGTALSIILEKPFYTLIKDYKSQRMTDLLGMLGLSDRIYTTKDKITTNIDYTNAKKVIEQEREKSFSYLKKMIELSGEKNGF